MEETRSPIYHEVSPGVKRGMQLVGVVSIIMMLLAFVFCLVQGAKVDKNFYLLACNTVISAIIGIVHFYWYRKGDLPADKAWYMIVVGLIITFQCLTTDVYVFNYALPVKPTPEPMITTTPPP